MNKQVIQLFFLGQVCWEAADMVGNTSLYYVLMTFNVMFTLAAASMCGKE